MQRTLTIALLLAPFGCDYEPRTDEVPAPSESSIGLDSPGDSSGGETDADESVFDEQLDVPPPFEYSCQKIDFLFVIDDSGSMGDEQERLIDGFPGFISGVQESIEQYDYHMMVVTTGFNWQAANPNECATAIGSGRTDAADGDACGLQAESSKRYASAGGEGLSDVFGCVADVGVTGFGDERPIWAMTQAITTHSRPGGCNEGFLRDDAILVVTIITDEEDDAEQDSPGDPAVWKEVVLSAKHGDESSVVMLGLLGDTDLDDGQCVPFEMGEGAEAAPRLREFVDSWQYGSWQSVCAADYTPFFNAAVEDIGAACSDFTPAP